MDYDLIKIEKSTTHQVVDTQKEEPLWEPPSRKMRQTSAFMAQAYFQLKAAIHLDKKEQHPGYYTDAVLRVVIDKELPTLLQSKEHRYGR